jgi:hypothetical protein
MILTVTFKIKNFVEVMESWPIRIGDTTFFLEREDNVVKRVGVSFAKVPVGLAPRITKIEKSDVPDEPKTSIKLSSGDYVSRAIQLILNWQSVVGGLQIFDIDYDHYETRFRAESLDEEDKIQLKSFNRTDDDALNEECDFEQIGRAFCVGQIDYTRIESTSHFREGRLAFAAGRFVDAYNNLFLFLETRYCDGKTDTKKQVDLLAASAEFHDAFADNIKRLRGHEIAKSEHLADLFDDSLDTKEKIRKVVLLRGKLRHHFLKSPHRWDPNKQEEYEAPARFLSSVVGHIVMRESLDDIYSPAALKSFREQSVSSGFETKIRIDTRRLNQEPSLRLDMSYPTTVISSKICLVALREAIKACKQGSQLADTVRLDATLASRGLELFTIDLDTWAETESRTLKPTNPLKTVRCSFEHSRHGLIVKDEFSLPINVAAISIQDAWNLSMHCFDWIEDRDPTTRVMNLKLFIEKGTRPLLEYRVGAQVEN